MNPSSSFNESDECKSNGSKSDESKSDLFILEDINQREHSNCLERNSICDPADEIVSGRNRNGMFRSFNMNSVNAKDSQWKSALFNEKPKKSINSLKESEKEELVVRIMELERYSNFYH